MMPDYPRFPLFIDLSEKNVLVVGAGIIGGRRAAVLARFCGHVEVVAPEAGPVVEAEAAAGRVRLHRRPFHMGDLEGRDMVLATTDNPALNAAIAEACRARGIPVNVSSDKCLCDFYFPGIVTNGGAVIGVTAGGSDHKRAAEITRRVREMLEREYH